MSERQTLKYRPEIERLEEKLPLSAGTSTAPSAILKAGSPDPPGAVGEIPAARPDQTLTGSPVPSADGGSKAEANRSVAPMARKPDKGYLVYRITNPNRFNNKLIPPFGQLLLQSRQPVPGQVYNVLYVAVRNGTARTFDASSGFVARFPGQTPFPVLTGSEQWKPGQDFIFYVLSKKYYPLPSVVTSGFEFDLGGARSVAIPGPSGIFLRVRYNPARFPQALDWIVTHGPGAQGGKGVTFGLPDTAIYEFVSAKTNRKDFGGYF